MDPNRSNKRKGGQQKAREKEAKLRKKAAESTHPLKEMFKRQEVSQSSHMALSESVISGNPSQNEADELSDVESSDTQNGETDTQIVLPPLTQSPTPAETSQSDHISGFEYNVPDNPSPNEAAEDSNTVTQSDELSDAESSDTQNGETDTQIVLPPLTQSPTPAETSQSDLISAFEYNVPCNTSQNVAGEKSDTQITLPLITQIDELSDAESSDTEIGVTDTQIALPPLTQSPISAVTQPVIPENLAADNSDTQIALPLLTQNDEPHLINDPSLHDEPEISFTDAIDVLNANQADNIPELDFYKPPSQSDINRFLCYHPRQQTNNEVLRKAFVRKNGTNRKWLSLSSDETLYCFLCMAFSKETTSNFVKGYLDRRHIHQRIHEHESSKAHQLSTNAYFHFVSNKSVDKILAVEQLTLRTQEVTNRRQVMCRIIEIVKFLGKRGMPTRGSNVESAYSLEDTEMDHGNFLELVLLIQKYDPILQKHVEKCIEESKRQKGNRGRGSRVTFLSKTMINTITTVLGKLIQKNIVAEIKQAGTFSIQIDTTQDITVQDQCSVVVRYVTNRVHERLLFVIRCDASTGEYFVEVVDDSLESVGLSLREAIGSSTDGANNMRGCYNGFKAHAIMINPLHLHIWCFSHRLNLVISKVTNVDSSILLFCLLNDVAVFIRESYTRMTVWDNFESDKVLNYRHKKLSPIGETRWWAKEVAVVKIFGHEDYPENGVYLQLVLVLNEIAQGANFNAVTRYKAKTFKDKLTHFDTILTAFVFIHIFKATSVLSNHLQKTNYDILTAATLINSTKNKINGYHEDFDQILERATNFAQHMNNQLQDTEIQIETTLKPSSRSRIDPILQYKENIFAVVISTVVNCFETRFIDNIDLLEDFGYLHPLQFAKIKNEGLAHNVFENLSKYVIKFNENATAANLKNELISLAENWENFKKFVSFNYDEEQIDDDGEIIIKNKPACKECIICVHNFLNDYNLMNNTYENIALAYKYVLTLSFTQVSCERSFSTLKYIKTRIRSTLTQENLQNNMLMHKEKDILLNLENEDIIDEVAKTSSLLKSLLVV